jgi:hypothetical protein
MGGDRKHNRKGKAPMMSLQPRQISHPLNEGVGEGPGISEILIGLLQEMGGDR